MINASPLAYWQSTRYRKSDVDKVCGLIDHLHAARISYEAGGQVGFTVSSRVGQTEQGHYPVCLALVKAVGAYWLSQGIELRGSFVVWLEDFFWDSDLSRSAPIFSFAKHRGDPFTLLIPDPAYINSKGYLEELSRNKAWEAQYPWAQKRPTLFWRGAASGLGHYGDNWRQAPRMQLALAAKRINDPQKIDTYISKLVDYRPTVTDDDIFKLEVLRPPCPFHTFLEYRYLAEVDGEACTWFSAFLKFSSRSAVVKVESDAVQWYSDLLLPWVHYIPLRRDMKDIDAILDWLAAHDSACRQIGLNASELMQSLTFEKTFRETAELMRQVLQCCD